jgi:PHD/YefM family antitoxin component YafN of YafNO toxin-antitoxin module
MATASATGKHQSGWIAISTDEYESMKETIEVLSDIDIIKQLEEGKKDSGKARDFESLAEELGI